MIKDMMDDQKVEVFNIYTGESTTKLWKFYTKGERETLERKAQMCYLLAECETADVLVIVNDKENWQ